MTRKNIIPDEPSFDEDELKGLCKDLAAFGYLLPTDDEELEGFNCVHGSTDVPLPSQFMEPNFLYNKKPQASPSKSSSKPSIKAANANAERPVPNLYFRKVVLAAEIAYQLHEEPTFGRIKFVKLLYLCEQVCAMNLNTNYKKFAAGPLDPKLIYTIEAQFKRLKWFKAGQRKNYGVVYEKLENVDQYRKYYDNYYQEKSEQVRYLINLFRKERSDFCEIVATLFYVWQECKATNSIVSNKKLFADFYAWDEKKLRFQENKLNEALDWMNVNQITPA